MHYGNIPPEVLSVKVNEDQRWDDTILTLKDGLDQIDQDIEHAVWIFRDDEHKTLAAFTGWTKDYVLFLNESMCEWYIAKVPRNPLKGS